MLKHTFAVAAVAGLLTLGGCQGALTSETAFVPVTSTTTSASEEVLVESSLKRDSKLGVRYLGAGAWDAAITKLDLAVQEGDNDSRTHHSLGVAYEMTGQYELAKAHYMAALENSGTQNFEYVESVRRIRTKLGETTYAGVID